MAKRIDWAVNVDKLRVCYNMPENLYNYLREHYTRHDEMSNARILDEDDFSLVFIEEDETKMSAVLNVRDVDGFFRLGTFTFSNSAKYEGKAFFTFENGALYRVYTRVPKGEPMNHICDLMYVADFYGMTFNNVTELELAFDSNYNYISKVRKMIKDVETLKHDAIGNKSTSVKAEIELGYFIVQMHSIQRYYQHTLLTFLGNLLGVQTQPVTDKTDTDVTDR